MTMASWSQSPGEKIHTPYIPSPLNPINAETSPRRQRRNDQFRGLRHEQSPTQRLMRHKAALAWRSMSSHNNAIINHAGIIHDEVEARMKPIERMVESYLVRASMDHHLRTLADEKQHEAETGGGQRDTEKQSLENDYRGNYAPEICLLLDVLTTRRLAFVVGILVTLGVLTIMRAVGRIQIWQT
ncbi:uncharacterized protein F4822DRAFT_31617 [Hypoxylon trugodes]|uniref:uncharacterized protein n=1 Tax=Hypoxylon trugodes TaxID=326681 RepID=UPI00219B2FCE|nr:uncharacterized protein F4822DRAFT_31617 [Hypoxylon trugodes]KAI1393958.1 hypothetical protein F4822DRAFT_31617 [Hypoxylon trugodes]